MVNVSAPLLVYVVMGALRLRGEPRRWQLLWLSLTGWAWAAISALNAGGDQWDNPRYRTILLAWFVLLAGWAWDWARRRKDSLAGPLAGGGSGICAYVHRVVPGPLLSRLSPPGTSR